MPHHITCATNDSDGVIQTIGNSGESWRRLDAVPLITSGRASFYVQQPGTAPADIHVYREVFLRTDPDGDSRNNLDNLNSCS